MGLTTALGFAKLGHSVVGVDVDIEKIKNLISGKLPFFEPGLELELTNSLDSGKISFSSSLESSAPGATVFFVCVPTPQKRNGSANLEFVRDACRQITLQANPGSVVVIKSTVPVGTGREISEMMQREDVHFASNPEFLREGSALQDFTAPDRVVVGSDKPEIGQIVLDLYESIDCPKILTSVNSAELIKYASNAYLATRLSFVNDLTAFCEKAGADIADVVHGMGLDSRIGKMFLQPGPGWGGSCFPKDTRALIAAAEESGISLGIVKAAIDSNEATFSRIVNRMSDLIEGEIEGKIIAVWGIAFKANTDDVRDSPALEIVKRLLSKGCRVVAFDPAAKIPDWPGLEQASTAASSVIDADALLILTEWSEFSRENPQTVAEVMKGTVVFDTRRILSVEKWSLFFDKFTFLGAR